MIKRSLNHFLPFLFLLFNTIFYNGYPTAFSITLLNVIYKSGDYLSAKNYRPIQISKLFANIYDRILYHRIYPWMNINTEQTAYQKNKSTLNHIFTLRLLIELSKKLNITLYIATIDLEKAFDKIPRSLLFKKLAYIGMGSFLLSALIAMYCNTSSSLCLNGNIYEAFNIFSGVKQGAATSALLFIIYIDEIIPYLKNNCINEFMIENLHILLHADDALIFSINRELFINKCNLTFEKFASMGLSLNNKSAFLVINSKNSIDKLPFETINGYLHYKSCIKYLGVYINDKGSLNDDINYSINLKKSEIIVKLRNFCVNNISCPWFIKKLILNSCIDSCILYSCETWSYVNPKQAEAMHRKAIKIIMGIKDSVNNEIIHLDSGISSLEHLIKSRQWKFWNDIMLQLNNDPENSINKLIRFALSKNIKFINHYRNIFNNHPSKIACKSYYENKFWTDIKSATFQKANQNPGAKLHTYIQINPSLSPNTFPSILETDRIIITRYRTGSHHLKIETGRWSRIPRDQRNCICENGIQDIQHVLLNCQLLNNIRSQNINTIFEFFQQDTYVITEFLLKAENILKISEN